MFAVVDAYGHFGVKSYVWSVHRLEAKARESSKKLQNTMVVKLMIRVKKGDALPASLVKV